MLISIIIPTYREAGNIQQLVNFLFKHGQKAIGEIIVSDAGSDDETMKLAEECGAIAFLSPARGRAAQMNFGASKAKGDILYFVHADVFPPETFASDIINAVSKGYQLGRYRMHFKTTRWWLRINEFFTRFDWFVCYGGDQTLFVDKALFQRTGGFNDDMILMEDFEFTKRARVNGRYKIFSKAALVSDRKYDTNSWWRVQKTNFTIVRMYKHGVSQPELAKAYKAMLDYR